MSNPDSAGGFRPPTQTAISTICQKVAGSFRGRTMLQTILIVVLILMLVGALPNWGHSANWGYGPSGGLGLVVVILIILMLTGRI